MGQARDDQLPLVRLACGDLTEDVVSQRLARLYDLGLIALLEFLEHCHGTLDGRGRYGGFHVISRDAHVSSCLRAVAGKLLEWLPCGRDPLSSYPQIAASMSFMGSS